MTIDLGRCQANGTEFTVLKAPQDAYSNLDGFTALVAPEFSNTINSQTITDTGFKIVCAEEINQADAWILFQAVKQFSDW